MFPYGKLQSINCIGPECELTIINPYNPYKKTSLRAIVDSGAVVTAIPKEIIKDLGNIVSDQKVYMKNADGSLRKVNTYHVKLQIGDEILTERVIAIPNKTYALIGRDILNKYKVVLDAVCKPTSEWRLGCNGYCNTASSSEDEV